jgi:hypothetical protein
MAVIRDYLVRIYCKNTDTAKNITFLARDRYHAISMAQEIYPEFEVQAVLEELQW